MSAPRWQILQGNSRVVLPTLPERSVHTVVTSPPYYGLRDYGMPAQFGLEDTPDEYVAALVAVFREVRRVLRDDGTVWLNLGDSYAHSTDRMPTQRGSCAGRAHDATGLQNTMVRQHGAKPKDLLGIPWLVAFALRADGWYLRSEIIWHKPNPMPESVTDRPTKAHEQVFLLSKSGDALLWTHRDGRAANVRPAPDYVWVHPETREESREAMPSPWRRRNLWRGHDYYYDADAIREGSDHPHLAGKLQKVSYHDGSAMHQDGDRIVERTTDRNKRSVWTVATQPYAGAHFATFPPKLIGPCILAGCPERMCEECGAPWMRVVERTIVGPGRARPLLPSVTENGDGRNGRDSATFGEVIQSRTVGFGPSCAHGDGSARGVVLDPFAGAGTTGMVALRHGRSFVGVELNPEYAALCRERITDDCPLHNAVAHITAEPIGER